MNIIIDSKLKDIYSNAALLVLIYEVNVEKSSKSLLDYQKKVIKELENKYELEDIVNIKAINDTRSAYKVLKKSPSSYRNAAEAMLRRISKKNGLYKINNVVDINNIVSITSGYSIGTYDIDQIKGDIILKSADENEKYEGIGKDIVNIEFIPTLYDDLSAFGNPTSDSQRAMISEGYHKVMSVIYSFSNTNDFNDIEIEYKRLLKDYCDVDNVEVLKIK